MEIFKRNKKMKINFLNFKKWQRKLMGRRILLTYHHQTLVFLFEIFVTPKIPAFLSQSFCSTSLRCSKTVLGWTKESLCACFNIWSNLKLNCSVKVWRRGLEMGWTMKKWRCYEEKLVLETIRMSAGANCIMRPGSPLWWDWVWVDVSVECSPRVSVIWWG